MTIKEAVEAKAKAYRVYIDALNSLREALRCGVECPSCQGSGGIGMGREKLEHTCYTCRGYGRIDQPCE
jgi:DnaJ-class molecular chaperone